MACKCYVVPYNWRAYSGTQGARHGACRHLKSVAYNLLKLILHIFLLTLLAVRQHLLRVVGNFTYCFVANLTGFRAVTEF